MIEDMLINFQEAVLAGGPILWVLILWGCYLYYLLFDTAAELKTSSNRCENLDCMFAQTCQAWQTVDLSCRSLRQDLLAEIEGRIRFLKLAVNAAPLLGLLGTVAGIFRTFQSMSLNQPGNGAFEALSEGISQALLTTQFGLILAIPSFMLLRRFIRKLHEMERTLTCYEYQCHRNWQYAGIRQAALPPIQPGEQAI
jgi:biopolymer transport protein ExbB